MTADELIIDLGSVLADVDELQNVRTDALADKIAQILLKDSKAAWVSQTDIVTLPSSTVAAKTVAHRAHSLAASLERDQLVVFSGVQGANVDRQVQAALSTLLAGQEASSSVMSDSVVAAETVLKAFGNANLGHGSSSTATFSALREFGLDSHGRITGYGIMTTTLEANRIHSLPVGQQSFEIVYQMLYGCSRSEREALSLLDEPSDYIVLADSASKRDAFNDSQDLDSLQRALIQLEFKPKQTQSMWRILSAILLLGNLRFDDDDTAQDQACYVANHDILSSVADLLSVSPDYLEQSLVTRLVCVKSELVSVVLDSSQAMLQARRLMTALYEMLFSFVVEKINHKLMAEHALTTVSFVSLPEFVRQDSGLPCRHFDFLVNVANEKLNQATTRLELDEEWSQLGQAVADGYSTNDPSLSSNETPAANDLLVGNSSLGGLLDVFKRTNAAVRKGTTPLDKADDAFLQSAAATFRSNSAFSCSTEARQFTIQHYVDTVSYDARDFVEQERNQVDLQWVDMLRQSADAFVAKLWSGPGLAFEKHPDDELAVIEAQVSSMPLRLSSHETRRRLDPARLHSRSAQLEATISGWIEVAAKAQLWRVFCIGQNAGSPKRRQDETVKNQINTLSIPQLVVRGRHSWVADLTKVQFEQIYGSLDVLDHLDASESLVFVGVSRIWLTWAAFVELEAHKPQRQAGIDEQLTPAQQLAQQVLSNPFGSQDVLPAETVYAGSQYDQVDAWDSTEKLWPNQPTFGQKGSKSKQSDVVQEVATSKARRIWVIIVWALTWWIPSFLLSKLGRMKRPDVRMAWREKVALCLLISFFCGVVIFYIIIFGRLLCPNNDKAWNTKEVGYHAGPSDFYVSVRGVVYDLTKFYRIQHSDIAGMDSSTDLMLQLAGQDLTQYFPLPLNAACPPLKIDSALALTYKNFSASIPTAIHTSGRLAPTSDSALYDDEWYWKDFLPRMRKLAKGPLVWTRGAIASEASKAGRRWAIYNQKVYDLEDYFTTIELYSTNPAYKFLNEDLTNLWLASPGTDVTNAVKQLNLNETTMSNNFDCMTTLFYAGELDFRQTPRCQVQPYLLLAFSIIIVAVMLAKFLASLQLSSKRMPELRDKFVICQVPCYTEGEDSLRKTIDSLATLTYDDRRKLIMIICDGSIVGSGNDRPTPDIVLDILGADRRYEPESLMFKSIAEGSKQLNYGKVWSGLYRHEGHIVPYLVVAKVGAPKERFRPGNRGKRDSQVLAMRFLNAAHNDSEMYPLELEMMHHCKNIIGVDPRAYEFMLVIDADTSVEPDSLNRLVSSCIDDSKIIGICGETKLENEKKTWWTMIQVYEYYISQFMAKAFESIFGSVTCLPGCFTMYRLRTPDGKKCLLVHSSIVDDYSENNLDTLHKKNLLALGEDRYLTTLILKHFPHYKTKFNGEAKAMTLAPDNLSVLVSQRRRWINSTVHNLIELVTLPDLCGFCCFSMRFVVMLDLIGTLILPATFAYLVYLIVMVSTHKTAIPYISLAMIGAVYGLQAIVFLLRRQWQFIGWLIIYIIAYPIYSFILPIYAFWRFDDFTWGQTRVVVGEGRSKKIVSNEDETFDESTLQKRKFADFEAAILDADRFSQLRPPTIPNSPVPMPQPPFAATQARRDSYGSLASLMHSPGQTPLHPPSLPGSPRAGTPPLQHYSPASVLHSPSTPPSPFADPKRASRVTMASNQMSYFALPTNDRGSMYSLNPFLTPPATLPTSTDTHPSKAELVQNLKTFLATQDLMTVTKRSVRESLDRMYPRANLGNRKDEIGDIIDGILEGRL